MPATALAFASQAHCACRKTEPAWLVTEARGVAIQPPGAIPVTPKLCGGIVVSSAVAKRNTPHHVLIVGEPHIHVEAARYLTSYQLSARSANTASHLDP